jgi:fumarylacetoacetase
MRTGRAVWREVRRALVALFSQPAGSLACFHEAFFELARVQMHMPCEVGDYTDFYASKEHACNVGEMFRGRDNALMPNWLHLPVGYHGRASSLVVSGTGISRPSGQIKPSDAPPCLSPTRKLDFELEMVSAACRRGLLSRLVGVCYWRRERAWTAGPVRQCLGTHFRGCLAE